MTTYVALLRAINVGGRGKMPMSELKGICAKLGFIDIETYIASGNVVFGCESSPEVVQAMLTKRLETYAGREVGVFVRTAAEIWAVLKKNPYPDKKPNHTYSFFLNEKPRSDCLAGVTGRANEEIALGAREIYVYYPDGMGQSKLKIPMASLGTARNLNTVAKLVEMSRRK